MAKNYKPEAHTLCVHCGRPVFSYDEYYWVKSRGRAPTFIHKECYEQLLPKKGD